MVILTTSEEEVGEAKELSALLAERFPGVRTVVQAVNGRKAQVATGDSEVVLHGDGAMQERLGDFRFEISPTSFFQTNTLQAEKLYGEVVQMARTGPNARVLDLYCGTGAISLFLSQEAQTVVGVELLEAALQDALRNAAANGIENCQFVAGKAEEVLGQMRARGEQFDSAVTDPPRAGMHPKALQAMADLAPETIVYVSCNPQALAMDLQRLEANGYKTDCLRLVDMFPHTPHCEVVVRLNRNQT
jgi:23S rRNA (uracil1939-C5)-methyltransferase